MDGGHGVLLLVGGESFPHHSRSPYVVGEFVDGLSKRILFKTKKSRVTDFPKWNHSCNFTFDPQSLDTAKLILTIWSSGHRLIGSKTVIGTAEVGDLKSLLDQEGRIRTYPVNVYQKGDKSGRGGSKSSSTLASGARLQLSLSLSAMNSRTGESKVNFEGVPATEPTSLSAPNRVQTLFLIGKIQEQLKKDLHLEDLDAEDSESSSDITSSEAVTCSLEEDFDLLFDMVADAQSQELSSRDITFVKDGWNKVLAFGNRMFFEALSERWFVLSPNTVSILGLETEDIVDFLYGWIDLAVHSYMPETEVIFRESFRPFHDVTSSLSSLLLSSSPSSSSSSPSSSLHPAIRRNDRFATIERYANHLATMGIPPSSILALDEAWYFALSTHTPYFLAEDREALLLSRSATPLVAMFRQKILAAYMASLELQTSIPERMTPLYRLYKEMVPPKKEPELGALFYKLLFDSSPELLEFFSNTDMSHLSNHLVQTIRLFLESRHSLVSLVPAMKALGVIHQRAIIPSWGFPLVIQNMAKLFAHVFGARFTEELASSLVLCFDLLAAFVEFPTRLSERRLIEAQDFFHQAAEHFGWSPDQLYDRKVKAIQEIYDLGTVNLTSEELAFGGQLAWRNSAKCVGRISWNTLLVRDCRHVVEPQAMFQECVEHLRLATAGTNLQSVMTVFRPRRNQERWGPRFWNTQLIRFAFWTLPDGRSLGDPANKELTDAICRRFPDWEPSDEVKTEFDILPLVLELPGKEGGAHLFELPDHIKTTIPISHPRNPRVASLGWKWCAVPTICNFNMRIAGVDFVCCPFNGWFADIEIARNFWDRYDAAERLLPLFPELMERKSAGFESWRDILFTELTEAIFHSFQIGKYTMVDRYSVCKQFATHIAREREAGREVPIQWSWIGGLMGPVYDVWHREGRDFIRFPQYEYQADIFSVAPSSDPSQHPHGQPHRKLDVFDEDEYSKALDVLQSGIPSLLILYGSETGTAECAARRMASEFASLHPRIMTLNDASTAQGRDCLLSDVVLVITSTFGAGQPPFNAVNFLGSPASPSNSPFPSLLRPGRSPVKFAVCGLGSSIYPDLAAFGKNVHSEFRSHGGIPIIEFTLADQMQNQAVTIHRWIKSLKSALIPPELAAALKIAGPPQAIPYVQHLPPAAAPTTFPPPRLLHYRAVPLLVNEELRCNPVNGESTRHLEFDVHALSSDGKPVYSAGDHLAIYPIVSLSTCQLLCKLLCVGLDDAFQINDISPLPLDTQPSPDHVLIGSVPHRLIGRNTGFAESMTWREFFSMHLDLTLSLSSLLDVLKLLCAAETLPSRNPSSAPPEITNLNEVINAINRSKTSSRPTLLVGIRPPHQNPDKRKNSAVSPRPQPFPGGGACPFSSSSSMTPASTAPSPPPSPRFIPCSFVQFPLDPLEFIDTFIDLPSLLSRLPSLASRIDLGQLVSLLPRMKPRFYSISSSPLRHPHTISLTVGVLVEQTKYGAKRLGICSNYLANSPVGSSILVSVRTSSFRLPESQMTPIICTGPGTGFAPFAGFLEERAFQLAQGIVLGEGLFYTGARTQRDAIYTTQIEAWNALGAGKVTVALSREGPKVRIQSLLEHDAERVVKLLLDEGGYYYCCGDARMADDTHRIILTSIAKVKQISIVKAKMLLVDLRAAGRYQTDIWGLMTSFSEGVIRINNQSAANAKNWYEDAKAWTTLQNLSSSNQ